MNNSPIDSTTIGELADATSLRDFICLLPHFDPYTINETLVGP